DLLTVDHVMVAFTPREGLDARGFRSGVRLGDAKRLQAQLTGGDPRQVTLFLLGAAIFQNRCHRVHLGMTGNGVAPATVDLLENERGFDHAETRAAVLLRNQRRQPAGLAQRFDEFVGIGVALIATAPVIIAETRTETRDRLSNFLLTLA